MLYDIVVMRELGGCAGIIPECALFTYTGAAAAALQAPMTPRDPTAACWRLA